MPAVLLVGYPANDAWSGRPGRLQFPDDEKCAEMSRTVAPIRRILCAIFSWKKRISMVTSRNYWPHYPKPWRTFSGPRLVKRLTVKRFNPCKTNRYFPDKLGASAWSGPLFPQFEAAIFRQQRKSGLFFEFSCNGDFLGCFVSRVLLQRSGDLEWLSHRIDVCVVT